MKRALKAMGLLGVVAFLVAPFAAWGTHVVWVISELASQEGATGGQITLGIGGTILPPIGVIHGVMIWLGVGM